MASYLRPRRLDEALAALADGGVGGRPLVVVAGATDHYPARVGRDPDEDILDVTALEDLDALAREEDGWWRIGARVTWSQLASAAELPPAFDGLRAAARTIGGRQVQNRATLVGNVANASPAADSMPNLLALDAVVELASLRGLRRVPAAAFVTGNRRTARAPDELVTALVVPDTGLARSTFRKLGSRAYLVISIASVAVVLATDGVTGGSRTVGLVTDARVAVGACSEVAIRLSALEAALVGQPARPGLSALVSPDHLAPLRPIDDVRGTAAYRREAAGVLVRRAIEELVAGREAVA
jgi:CO/xanthine dehydrogenase FAD-binding subunit